MTVSNRMASPSATPIKVIPWNQATRPTVRVREPTPAVNGQGL